VEAELPDLGKFLQAKLAASEQAAAVSYKQDVRYKELTKILGTAEGDEEDEDLEVVHTQVRLAPCAFIILSFIIPQDSGRAS
jgi:hypothetical protein